MSSHHFVKEDQEPSVWILGNDFSEDTLGTLLEWSPKVIADLSTADKLLSLQIKMDQILSPFHQEQEQDFFTSLYPLEWIETENTIQYVFSEMSRLLVPFYIVGLNSEQMSAIYSQAPDDIKTKMIGITYNTKWICPNGTWKKWISQNQSFQLTGEKSDWEIIGNVENLHPHYRSLEDQLITFENKNHHCFIEFLSQQKMV